MSHVPRGAHVVTVGPHGQGAGRRPGLELVATA